MGDGSRVPEAAFEDGLADAEGDKSEGLDISGVEELEAKATKETRELADEDNSFIRKSTDGIDGESGSSPLSGVASAIHPKAEKVIASVMHRIFEHPCFIRTKNLPQPLLTIG